MSGEPNLCSFTLAEADADEAQYTCSQPVLPGTDRCIWHSQASERPADAFPKTVAPDTALRGANLTGATLRGIEFGAGVDLRDSTFADATLRDCDLARTNLDGCEFTDASATASTFERATFTGAQLGGFTAVDSSFADATLDRTSADTPVTFSHCELEDAVFARADLDRLELDECVATGFDLTEVTCHRLTATDTTLSNLTLITADVADIRVESCHLRGAVIRRTLLDGGSFTMCDLRDATLHATSAVGVEFDATRLAGARCRDCAFQDASFRGADLSGADLTDSDFTGSDLTDADLSGAVLDGVTLQDSDLSGVQLHDATLDAATQFPSVSELRERGLTIPEVLGLYRALVTLLEDADLTTAAFRRRAEYYALQRKHARREGRYGRYLGLVGSAVVTGHGQRPIRVLFSSVMVIAYFAALYAIEGIGVQSGQPDAVEALVFSVQVFSPGVVTSVAETTQRGALLVTAESTLGLVFLVVFAVLAAQRLQTL